MAVFRELSFAYQGEEITVVPSLALLRRIKGKGINNVVLAQKCVSGGVDIEDLAAVHAEFMAEAGKPISEDESYAFLTGGNMAEIQDFQATYIQSVLPGVDLGKKPAPRSAPKKKPRKKSSKS